MIKPLHKLLLTILFVVVAATAFCQTGTVPGDDDKTKPDDKTNDQTAIFKFGLNYLSNNVFMGRSDTVTTPTIVPEVKYTLKSGIFFSGSLYYIPGKKKNKIDGGDLEAGYNLDISDNLSGSASFSKLFYSANSTQIASSISGTFNADLSYDIGDIITPSISADYDLNKGSINNDVFFTAELSHDFIHKGIFGDEDILLVSPTATVNTGTENFYDAYLTTKKKIRGPKRTAAINALITQYTNQLSQFALLDYELSAPLDYKTGHFLFQFTPTYAIVKNQLPKAIEARISNQPSIFYYEIGVFLKF